MTDQNEEIINQYAYSPFGRILGQTEAEGLEQPFKYVGQFGVQHEQNEIYYMRARYYDAETGRFLKEDPIGFDGGLNLSLYVGGNPVVGIDPSGLIFANLIGGLVNVGIDFAAARLTGQDFNLSRAGVAFVAGASGVAAASLISRTANVFRGGGAGANVIGRNIGRIEVTSNAIAGGVINVGAGAANGSTTPGRDFAFGAAGSLGGSAVVARTTAISGLGLGAIGVSNGAGQALGNLTESGVAAASNFLQGVNCD